MRQRAIVEERHRIARELHDGLAQLLGYVNTKAMAIRLMLQKQQVEAADHNLLQLEETARELFVDVREAILDPKIAGQDGTHLSTMLKDYIAQSRRLSDMAVEFVLHPAVEDLPLSAENERQLLRIVQKALTNVRKHASANDVCISSGINDGVLEVTVSDGGTGFDPNGTWTSHRPHFGLRIMPERAAAIGAEFDLESEPGTGTQITVRLPLDDASSSIGAA